MNRDDRGRFVNLDGSTPHSFSSVLRWGLVERFAGRRRRSPSRAAIPRVTPDLEHLRAPPAVGEPARLTWLGHASWLVQLDGMSFLIDPVLFDRITPWIKRNVPAPIPPADLPRIDAQLVTHSHYDHLDMPSLQAIRAPVVTGLGLDALFSPAGLVCRELGWWEPHQVGPVTVTYVPSQHWSRRGLNDANVTLWGGFVIDGSTARLYHSGDTAFFSGFTEIGRRFPGIDAAMLPIGAYDPAWFMEKQHMNPEQAVQAWVDLGARRFLAMHWGTFKLTDEPLTEPPERLEAEWRRRALEADAMRILAVGETIIVGR